jgi:hypothetical protein
MQSRASALNRVQNLTTASHDLRMRRAPLFSWVTPEHSDASKEHMGRVARLPKWRSDLIQKHLSELPDLA